MWDWHFFGTSFWGRICPACSGFGPIFIKTIILVRNGPDLSLFNSVLLLPQFVSHSLILDINSGKVDEDSCLQEDELT